MKITMKELKKIISEVTMAQSSEMTLKLDAIIDSITRNLESDGYLDDVVFRVDVDHNANVISVELLDGGKVTIKFELSEDYNTEE
jgi:hypothetical protein